MKIVWEKSDIAEIQQLLREHGISANPENTNKLLAQVKKAFVANKMHVEEAKYFLADDEWAVKARA